MQVFKVTTLLHVKSLVQQGKGGYQRKNAPVGAQKWLICLKQKDLSNSGVPATSTRCPDHLSREFLTTASTFPYSTKNYSVERIHAFYARPCVREWEWEREGVCVCVCVCVCERERERARVNESVSVVCVCVFIYVNDCVCKDEACWYIVNMFWWGIFRTVWKGRGGGQELSAEVIRAPGWGSRYPPFRSVFLL